VFFPKTILPLHLFEPRYRQMGEDAIRSDGELVIVLLKAGWEQDYGGNPPVHEIATLGTIEDHEELDDGRFNIVLYGSERVRLLAPEGSELRYGKLYRERRIERAIETCPREGDDETTKMMGRLRERWEELLEKSGPSDHLVDASSSTAPAPFDAFVNRIASATDIPPRLKQELLEEDDVLARAARLETLLNEQLKFWRTLAHYRNLKPEDPSVN
jgi:Lon protease-like protein